MKKFTLLATVSAVAFIFSATGAFAANTSHITQVGTNHLAVTNQNAATNSDATETTSLALL